MFSSVNLTTVAIIFILLLPVSVIYLAAKNNKIRKNEEEIEFSE